MTFSESDFIAGWLPGFLTIEKRLVSWTGGGSEFYFCKWSDHCSTSHSINFSIGLISLSPD